MTCWACPHQSEPLLIQNLPLLWETDSWIRTSEMTQLIRTLVCVIGLFIAAHRCVSKTERRVLPVLVITMIFQQFLDALDSSHTVCASGTQ